MTADIRNDAFDPKFCVPFVFGEGPPCQSERSCRYDWCAARPAQSSGAARPAQHPLVTSPHMQGIVNEALAWQAMWVAMERDDDGDRRG